MSTTPRRKGIKRKRKETNWSTRTPFYPSACWLATRFYLFSSRSVVLFQFLLSARIHNLLQYLGAFHNVAFGWRQYLLLYPFGLEWVFSASKSIIDDDSQRWQRILMMGHNIVSIHRLSAFLLSFWTRFHVPNDIYLRRCLDSLLLLLPSCHVNCYCNRCFVELRFKTQRMAYNIIIFNESLSWYEICVCVSFTLCRFNSMAKLITPAIHTRIIFNHFKHIFITRGCTKYCSCV